MRDENSQFVILVLFCIVLVFLFYSVLVRSYYVSGATWPNGAMKPHHLSFSVLDYLKALICWLDSYRYTYAIRPGLYFTGSHYDQNAPLLITANYLLTVLLLVRNVRNLNVRILVIDTDGINVWCSAGKGRFSHFRIIEELSKFERNLLTPKTWLTLILPKFCMSGVDLRALRRAKIRPIIGPLYAKDLPGFLSREPFRNCQDDQVTFGLQSRLFTWLPGFKQTIGYLLSGIVLLLGIEWFCAVPVPWILVVVAVTIATLYPLLFPWIPGVRFAVKGIWLGWLLCILLSGMLMYGQLTLADYWVAISFSMASAIFFGLSYSGNSAVSNYTSVRQETARFLPLSILLYVFCLFLFIYFSFFGDQ